MLVDPIKPMSQRLKLSALKQKNDELLSTFAFKLNLRRYTKASQKKTA